MKITTHWNTDFVEVFFESNNAKINSGLLGRNERLQLIENLIELSYELMDKKTHGIQKAILATITENL